MRGAGTEEDRLTALIRYYYLTKLKPRDRPWYEDPVDPEIYTSARAAVGELPASEAGATPEPARLPIRFGEVRAALATVKTISETKHENDRYIRAAEMRITDMRHRPTRWEYFEYCAYMQSESLWTRITSWLEWRLRIVITAIAWALGLTVGLPLLALGLIALEAARQLYLGAELISNARLDAFQVVVSGSTLKMSREFNRTAADSITVHKLINDDHIYKEVGFWIALAGLGDRAVNRVATRVVAYSHRGADPIAVEWGDGTDNGPPIGTADFTAHIMGLRETKMSNNPLAAAKNDLEYVQHTWLEDGGQNLAFVQEVFITYLTLLAKSDPSKTSKLSGLLERVMPALRGLKSGNMAQRVQGLVDAVASILKFAEGFGMDPKIFAGVKKAAAKVQGAVGAMADARKAFAPSTGTTVQLLL